MRAIVDDRDIMTEESESNIIGSQNKRQKAKFDKTDTYSDKIIKYVPTEVIILYISLETILKSQQNTQYLLHWFIFIFGIVATYLYLNRIGKVVKTKQLVISMLAFCVWVFAMGGPFSALSWYNSIYGAILLPIYTFCAPLIK